MANKPFSTKFKLNSKILAILFLCYKYKFPLCLMLSFYEMYGDNALFTFKALACTRKINLNEVLFMKILDESRLLYREIIKGSNILAEYEHHNIPVSKETEPTINLDVLSDDFKEFVNCYLLPNVEDLYAPQIKLKMSTNDLYEELTP